MTITSDASLWDGEQQWNAKDGWSLVDGGTKTPHQLFGATDSDPSSKDLCQDSDRSVHPLAPRQLDGCGLHKQSGRNSVEKVNYSHDRFVGVVPGTQHTNRSPTPPRVLERHSGRGESHPQGPLRLDVAPTRVQQYKPLIWATGSGSTCIEANYSTANLLQLETRPPGQSHGRSAPGLVHDKGICQPTMGPSTGSGSSTASASGTSGTSVEDAAMVLRPVTHVGRPPKANTSLTLDQQPGYSSDRTTPPASRMAHFREKYAREQLSEEATDLMLKSWRTKTNKSCLTSERGSDPISGPSLILAYLFKEGYQYRSLNAYWPPLMRRWMAWVWENIPWYLEC